MSVYDSFLAIHCEPNWIQWSDLWKLLSILNKKKIPSTIMLHPNWFPSASDIDIEKLLANLARGHEFGLHHHGIHHMSWDGYSNLPEAADHVGFKGTMKEYMAGVFEFLDRTDISAATIGACSFFGADTDNDWEPPLSYRTAGVQTEEGFSPIIDEILNGRPCKRLGHANITNVSEQIQYYFQRTPKEFVEYFGSVLHAFYVTQNKQLILSWAGFLTFLRDVLNVRISTAGRFMKEVV